MSLDLQEFCKSNGIPQSRSNHTTPNNMMVSEELLNLLECHLTRANSPVCEAALHEIQKIMEEPVLHGNSH